MRSLQLPRFLPTITSGWVPSSHPNRACRRRSLVSRQVCKSRGFAAVWGRGPRQRRLERRAKDVTVWHDGVWPDAPRPTSVSAWWRPWRRGPGVRRPRVFTSPSGRCTAGLARGESLTERPRSGRPPKLPPARYGELHALVSIQMRRALPEHAARPRSRHRDPAQPLPPESDPAPARSAAQKSPRSPPNATRRAWLAGADGRGRSDRSGLARRDEHAALLDATAQRHAASAPWGRVPRGNAPPLLVGHPDQRGSGRESGRPGRRRSGDFEAFVARVLVPKLRPGQIVVLDNLKVHESPKARRLIEGLAAGFFLPTYSPDCNPIEQAFAKIKQALRRFGTRSLGHSRGRHRRRAAHRHRRRCPRLLHRGRFPLP